MIVSIEEQILKKIKKAKRGSLFFPEYFSNFGSARTVGKSLVRIEKTIIFRNTFHQNL